MSSRDFAVMGVVVLNSRRVTKPTKVRGDHNSGPVRSVLAAWNYIKRQAWNVKVTKTGVGADFLLGDAELTGSLQVLRLLGSRTVVCALQPAIYCPGQCNSKDLSFPRRRLVGRLVAYIKTNSRLFDTSFGNVVMTLY